jgi:hypothetical protein
LGRGSGTLRGGREVGNAEQSEARNRELDLAGIRSRSWGYALPLLTPLRVTQPAPAGDKTVAGNCRAVERHLAGLLAQLSLLEPLSLFLWSLLCAPGFRLRWPRIILFFIPSLTLLGAPYGTARALSGLGFL